LKKNIEVDGRAMQVNGHTNEHISGADASVTELTLMDRIMANDTVSFEEPILFCPHESSIVNTSRLI
jgi:hypothetical protein